MYENVKLCQVMSSICQDMYYSVEFILYKHNTRQHMKDKIIIHLNIQLYITNTYNT